MKVVACTGPGQLTVLDLPMPLIEPDEALVRIETCALCNGTDSAIASGVFPYMPEEAYPFILGHESVGTVVEVGDAVESLAEGDRVLRPAARAESMAAFWGGLAEYGVVVDVEARRKRRPGWVPDGMSLSQQKVPDTLGPEEASVLIPLKETLSWIERVGLHSGESVLILGSGPVALCFSVWGCLLGASPTVLVGRSDKSLKRASRFGAFGTLNTSNPSWQTDAMEWAMGRGFDLIVDTTGSPDLIVESSRLLASTGRIGLYGVMKRGQGLSVSDLKGEWRLLNVSPQEWRVHDRVLRALELGAISPKSFITHVLPMEQTDRALALVASRDAIKVVIRVS